MGLEVGAKLEDGKEDGSLDLVGLKDGHELGAELGGTLGSLVGMVEMEGFCEGSDDGDVDFDGSRLGLEDGSLDLVGLKDGHELGAELGLLQSLPQNGPKSASTGFLLYVQSVPVKILSELS